MLTGTNLPFLRKTAGVDTSRLIIFTYRLTRLSGQTEVVFFYLFPFFISWFFCPSRFAVVAGGTLDVLGRRLVFHFLLSLKWRINLPVLV
jgi:hypothetical protein